MSIERAFGDFDGDITIDCDECGESIETRTDNFNDAIAWFKREGGKVERVAGEWFHTCASCATEEDEDDFEALS